MSAADIFLGLLAIIFPPLAVWIKSGICSFDSFINILLCLLGYLPGLIHAWYIISLYPEPDYDYEPINDAERGGGGTRYYIVADSSQRSRNSNMGNAGSAPTNGGGYGTTNQGPPRFTNSDANWDGEGHGRTSTDAGGEGSAGSGSGAGSRAPPTYAEAVRNGSASGGSGSGGSGIRGDHKVQTQD